MQKQPKFSRELLDWRRRQHLLARWDFKPSMFFWCLGKGRMILCFTCNGCPRRQKNYAEAEKIKRLADTLEARETQKIGQNRKQQIKKLEVCAFVGCVVKTHHDRHEQRVLIALACFVSSAQAQFRQDQQKELTALLKRIDGRRKEHIKQRNTDSQRSCPSLRPHPLNSLTHTLRVCVCSVPECEKGVWSWNVVLRKRGFPSFDLRIEIMICCVVLFRLLQRNKNLQAVLENKQNIQAQSRKQEISESLQIKQRGATGSIKSSIPKAQKRKKKKKGPFITQEGEGEGEEDD